jgi:hypothetical protein
MKEISDNSLAKDKNRIPRSLLITGIFSILGTSSTIFSSFQAMIFGKPSNEEIIKVKIELAKTLNEVQKNNFDFLADLIRKIQVMMDAMYQNFVLYTIVAVVVSAIGLTAIVLMFIRKELGFHFYIIYSLLYVAQSYIFVSPEHVPLIFVLTNLGFSGIFIYIYSKSLNWFRKLNN